MKTQIAGIMIEILKALTPVFALFISYLGLKINKYLNAKIKDEELKVTMTKVNSIILDVVKDVEQSYVKKEKAESKTASLSPESAETAKNLAFDKIKFQLGDKIMQDLKKKQLTASEDEFIKTKIESNVFDMKKTTALLLPIVFFFFLGCSHISTVANTLKVHDDIVRTADNSVAKWFTDKSTECLQKGIKVKAESKTPEKADQEGYVAYNTCIKHPSEIAMEIAEIIDEIRKDNKEKAKIALDVAKRTRPDTDLGDVNAKFSVLFKRLRYLVSSENIQ